MEFHSFCEAFDNLHSIRVFTFLWGQIKQGISVAVCQMRITFWNLRLWKLVSLHFPLSLAPWRQAFCPLPLFNSDIVTVHLLRLSRVKIKLFGLLQHSRLFIITFVSYKIFWRASAMTHGATILFMDLHHFHLKVVPFILDFCNINFEFQVIIFYFQ